MTRTRWLWLAAASGLTIFALSFVPAWIAQERELRGEGYRFVQVVLSAWRGHAVPVSAVAAGGAAGLALLAAGSALGRIRMPAWLLPVGSTLVAGLVAAAAWPVMQAGHASTVRLNPAWLLPIVLVLAVGMVVAVVAATRPSRGVMISAALVGLIAVAGGASARWLGLQLAEGTGEHWEVGSYTRPITDGEPSVTMTLAEESYVIGDRWSGSFESSGWTVVFDDDPACPDSRGTYHAHGVNEEDLRFVMVVDTCEDGDRAAVLQAATWERDP